MVQIKINRYPVSLKLGYFCQERMVLQDVYVSLALALRSNFGPGASDDLGKTLDYGIIMKMLDEMFVGREIKLVETVVELIGLGIIQHLLEVESVQVSVEKTSLPKAIGKGATVTVEKSFYRTSAECQTMLK